MSYALWLNGKKVFHADEIRDNLDIASLCGYFTAGRLIEWLKSNGGERYAKELENISPKAPELRQRFAEVFGGQPVKYKEFGDGNPENSAAPNSGSFISVSSALSSFLPSSGGISSDVLKEFSSSSGKFGSAFPLWKLRLMPSFNFSSYSFGSYLLNIGFGAYGGSFSLSSFSYGSLGYEWELEWERFLQGFGSFSSKSFVYGSFVLALRAFLMQKYGSWRFGSWNFGSWNRLKLLRLLYGSFGSGRVVLPSSAGSFKSLALNGGIVDSDEYDRIMLECVFGCKLNCYGYGIHNI